MQLTSFAAPIDLDLTTLFVIATCITALLGLLLLSTWSQERVKALAWWGSAYLIGGFSVAVWSVEGSISPPLPVGAANTLVFVACGMIWSAARLFHGRRVRWVLDAGGRGGVVRRLLLSGICAIDGRAHHPEFADHLHLHVPHRRRAVARTPQVSAAALAGDLRADPARRRLSVADSAREPVAVGRRHGQPGDRMDRGVRARSHALHGRHRVHRAGACQGAQRPRPARRRLHRRTDRSAQPSRLLWRRPSTWFIAKPSGRSR